MDSRFIQLTTLAEKLNWTVYDFQPENCLVSFVKEGFDDVRVNVWCGRKGITVGVQYKLSKTTKHKYFYKMNNGSLSNLLKKENVKLMLI